MVRAHEGHVAEQHEGRPCPGYSCRFDTERERVRQAELGLRIDLYRKAEACELAGERAFLGAHGDPHPSVEVGDTPRGEERERHPAERLGELRSEEHTSELQSLMRTSHAVFYLKHKKNRR